MKKDKVILTDIIYIFNNNDSPYLSEGDLRKLCKQQSALKWDFINFDPTIRGYHFHKRGK